jgi:hypothetical protein
MDLTGKLSTGAMARYLGLLESQLRKLADRSEVPCQRFNRQRVFDPRDAEAILAAARKRGYLKAATATAPTA